MHCYFLSFILLEIFRDAIIYFIDGIFFIQNYNLLAVDEFLYFLNSTNNIIDRRQGSISKLAAC